MFAKQKLYTILCKCSYSFCRVLWKRRVHTEEIPDDWNTGNLIYYGRAELKQSDHRPVMAILDIEVIEADPEARTSIFKKVIKEAGPQDATVVIASHGHSLYTEDDFKTTLLDNLSQYGEVVIVRQVEDSIFVVFRDSYSALLLAQSGSTVLANGETLEVSFRTADYEAKVWDAVRLCGNNTIPLCKYSSVIPPRCATPNRQPPESKLPPPSRPPQPVAKPKAAVISVSSPSKRPNVQKLSKDSSDSSIEDYKSMPAPKGPPPSPPPPVPVVSAAPPPVPPRTNIRPPVPTRPK